MNDLDVILATVEELREYMWRKRGYGRAACARRITRLRKELVVKVYANKHSGGVTYVVAKRA